MYENGFVPVDMDTFSVVLSTKTFTNYRRANAEVIETANPEQTPKGIPK